MIKKNECEDPHSSLSEYCIAALNIIIHFIQQITGLGNSGRNC